MVTDIDMGAAQSHVSTPRPSYETATELQVQIISNAHAIYKLLAVGDMPQYMDFSIIITKKCPEDEGIAEYHAIVVVDASKANFVQGPVRVK